MTGLVTIEPTRKARHLLRHGGAVKRGEHRNETTISDTEVRGAIRRKGPVVGAVNVEKNPGVAIFNYEGVAIPSVRPTFCRRTLLQQFPTEAMEGEVYFMNRLVRSQGAVIRQTLAHIIQHPSGQVLDRMEGFNLAARCNIIGDIFKLAHDSEE